MITEVKATYDHKYLEFKKIKPTQCHTTVSSRERKSLMVVITIEGLVGYLSIADSTVSIILLPNLNEGEHF